MRGQNSAHEHVLLRTVNLVCVKRSAGRQKVRNFSELRQYIIPARVFILFRNLNMCHIFHLHLNIILPYFWFHRAIFLSEYFEFLDDSRFLVIFLHLFQTVTISQSLQLCVTVGRPINSGSVVSCHHSVT
jgi:hypothetical protein